jgi:spermidine/putrescine transport system substrate-binding protein
VNRRDFLTVVAILSLSGTLSADKKSIPDLSILNYEDYFAPNTIKNYELLNGKKISLSTYGSDSEMIAKFLESNPPQDILIISDYMVEYFRRLGGLLEKIDKSRLNNLQNIDKSFFKAAFDPGRNYSVPYFWGTIGIGYRKSAFDGEPDSLKWLFDSDTHSKKIALFADGATNIMLALKFLGYSINTTKKEEIVKAGELLKRQKDHIAYFADDNGQDLLKEGKVDIVLEYNGDMLQLMDESDEFGFVVPREGSILWEDCIVFPTMASHQDERYKFVDYLLDADVAKELSEYLMYATPNIKAKEKMPKSYTQNRTIFPPKEILQKCERVKYNGLKVKKWYDEVWMDVMAR